MEEGTTIRLDCEECSREFEITLEPKLKGKRSVRRQDVLCCPFCASERVTGDEEDNV